jgi:hypothetical protein
LRSLIAYAIMALKNWKVTGSIGGAQNAHVAAPFPSPHFRRNHARTHRDRFSGQYGYEASRTRS